jgi:hypothetical protein
LPYFWDKTADTLPRPELNPLANPALERNLSRWAEVYFGNPPGKREEAIGKLLQEIKNETSEILIAERARRESSTRSAEVRSEEIRSTEIGSTKMQDARCPTCRHQNPARQRFCGECGAALGPSQSGSEKVWVFTDPQSPAEASTPDSEVQWLRDRALGGLYGSQTPARRSWKYMLGGLMIVTAGLAYLQWNPSHLTRVASPVTIAAPRITTSASASPVPAENPSSVAAGQAPEAIPSASKPSAPNVSEIHSALVTPGAQIVHDRKTRETGIQPAVQKSSLIGAKSMPRAVESGDSGSADLRLAQRYLVGTTGVRDSSEAAKLLWKAVGKQNATAAVLLSGLYARGDGVSKNCDQARLLLVAATRHGAPQAAEQLRDLERRGCQ